MISVNKRQKLARFFCEELKLMKQNKMTFSFQSTRIFEIFWWGREVKNLIWHENDEFLLFLSISDVIECLLIFIGVSIKVIMPFQQTLPFEDYSFSILYNYNTDQKA